MSKIYFEMNDKERQLRHIGDTIDYAICMFGEGLSGTGKYNIPNKDVIELQSKISDQLLCAMTDIEKLLKAVEEEEEEKLLEMFPVKSREDIKELTDYTVYTITETTTEEGKKGYIFVLRSELIGGGYVFKNLLASGDGNLYISDIY
jgi:hypothetical protein